MLAVSLEDETAVLASLHGAVIASLYPEMRTRSVLVDLHQADATFFCLAIAGSFLSLALATAFSLDCSRVHGGL